MFVDDISGAFSQDVLALNAEDSPGGVDSFFPKAFVVYCPNVVAMQVRYGHWPLFGHVRDSDWCGLLFVVTGFDLLVEVVNSVLSFGFVCFIADGDVVVAVP